MSERGMMKWAPYKTLEEQWEQLEDDKDSFKKVEKPILTSDQEEEINSILTTYGGELLEFSYYGRGKIFTEVAHIKKIDTIDRIIVLDNSKTIKLSELVRVKRKF